MVKSRRGNLRAADDLGGGQIELGSHSGCECEAVTSLLLNATAPLSGADGVAGILVLDDGRYIMQLRDEKQNLWYPGHWGCFGGAVERGESPVTTLARELREELEYELEALPREFTRFDFDFSALGPRQKKVYCIYYEVPVSAAAFGRMVLHEGAGMEAIEARELLIARPVTPYDAFAVWLHFSRHRFST